MIVSYSETALKQLKKLDKKTISQIVDYMDEISTLSDPKQRGKALVGNLSGLWRYRVGDYRIICSISLKEILITVLKIGHRKEVYD